MGLSSLNIGVSALRSNLASLDTIGHNIANANTEGYSRQKVTNVAERAQLNGAFAKGRGVKVASIERVTDRFLLNRLRKEIGNLAGLEQSASTMKQIEFAVNELSDADLSSRMGDFFSSIDDFSNNVEDNSTRVGLMEQAISLSTEFNRLDSSFTKLQDDLSSAIGFEIEDANQYINEIAEINGTILEVERGGLSSTVANDLRDQRDLSIQNLSKIISVDAKEGANGTLFVTSAGQVLVSQGVANTLQSKLVSDGEKVTPEISYEAGGVFVVDGGRLGAMIESRDVMIEDIKDELNDLSSNLIFQFNRVHSTGRGLEGLSQVTSEHFIFDPAVSLADARLDFEVEDDSIFKFKNGSFDVLVEDVGAGTVKSYSVNIDLNGVGDESSLNDVLSQLSAIPDISATLNARKQLEIKSENSNVKFHFGNDSSDFLATMGINNFFTGVDASEMAVNEVIENNPAFLAGALTNSAGDNDNAINISNIRTSDLFKDGQLNLDEFYQTFVGDIAVKSNRATSLVETHEMILQNLQNLRDGVSDVSLDEEAADLLRFQRSYQASARFISIINEVLETLIFRLQ